jgi:hypothetical protein
VQKDFSVCLIHVFPLQKLVGLGYMTFASNINLHLSIFFCPALLLFFMAQAILYGLTSDGIVNTFSHTTLVVCICAMMIDEKMHGSFLFHISLIFSIFVQLIYNNVFLATWIPILAVTYVCYSFLCKLCRCKVLGCISGNVCP